MNYARNDSQQFSFITPFFSDTCRHTKNKSWRRCRFYFRGRMQCWWIFDFETDYRSYRVSNNNYFSWQKNILHKIFKTVNCTYFGLFY
jgi:hypothetical protein